MILHPDLHCSRSCWTIIRLNRNYAMKRCRFALENILHKCPIYTLECHFTFVDMNFKHFFLTGDFPTLTVFASVLGIDAFSLALALRANRLHLLNEARTKLLDTHLNTSPTASRTFLHRSGFTSTTLRHIHK